MYEGHGFWWIFPLLWLLFFAFVFFALWRRGGRQAGQGRDSAEDVLRRRFASGEIGADEYRRQREVLRE